jgi:hypothetical protein
MSDPKDWADLLSPNTDLSRAVPADKDGHCPWCGDVEYRWQIFKEESAETPEQISGHVFTMCLCGNLYQYEGVHEVRADQPVGEAIVRGLRGGAVEPTEAMPPGRNNTLDVANEIACRRPAFNPALYVPTISQQNAAYPYWTVEADQRRRAVAAFYAANGATQVILPPNQETRP